MVIIAWRVEVSQFKASARWNLNDDSQQASEVEGSRDGSNRQENYLRASGRWLPWSSREGRVRDATDKLDGLFDLHRPVEILLERSMKLSNWRVESGLGKRRIQTPTTQYRARSVTLLWAHNLLLEGVADRDWVITSTMAMVALTGKSCFRIFILQNYDLWYPRDTQIGQLIAVGESQRKDPKILYLGSVRINIPKLKYSALSFVHTFL